MQVVISLARIDPREIRLALKHLYYSFPCILRSWLKDFRKEVGLNIIKWGTRDKNAVQSLIKWDTCPPLSQFNPFGPKRFTFKLLYADLFYSECVLATRKIGEFHTREVENVWLHASPSSFQDWSEPCLWRHILDLTDPCEGLPKTLVFPSASDKDTHSFATLSSPHIG